MYCMYIFGCSDDRQSGKIKLYNDNERVIKQKKSCRKKVGWKKYSGNLNIEI